MAILLPLNQTDKYRSILGSHKWITKINLDRHNELNKHRHHLTLSNCSRAECESKVYLIEFNIRVKCEIK